MATHHLGRIVIGCLAGGLVIALALVLGPVAGAQEHVITGTVLLTFAASWALVATLSRVWTEQPQRWAFAVASFMALAGAALLVFAPSGAVIDALGWIWPPLFLGLLAGTIVRVHRDLQSRSRFWVVYPLLGVYALCALGAAYETIRESLDRRTYVAPGQLIDVGGHRLHLHCAGSGSPTVLLESGLGETAAYWGWISAAVARDTRVCAYDRAGRGWSDPVSLPQDGVAVATDLHTLLGRAGVPGPFVLVGHSSGAQYVRIFAGRYPEQVAGIVLLDGQPAEAFDGLPAYPTFYNRAHRVFALLPSLARLGVGRLVPADPALPQPARDIQHLHHASARLYRSLRDEFAELPTSLAQARSSQSLGDRPLVVVTAAVDPLVGWLALQDRMARLSTNSSHRVVPYAHEALVTDQTAADTSIQAIRDVVHAVRFDVPLKKPSGADAAGPVPLDAYIGTSMHTARIPGLALGVVRDDRIIYLKGYGIAGPDGRPVTPQTPFILGSTSKSLTALAVMQLVEAGRIDLDVPVTTYLPWFRTQNATESAQIRVRHLLHHTSGLQTSEGRRGFGNNDQGSIALENGIRELSSAQLRQPPGQRYEYNNENYDALGLIVQAVSGISYEEYVRSAIFSPLQMRHSAASLSDPAAADVASGHRYRLLWPVAFDAPYPRRMTPAGFLISSAEDMAHYLVAQLNGGTYEGSHLLSRQGVAALHAPASRMGPTDSYGMGWAIHGAPGSTTIWHDGDVSNFHSHLRLLPDQHLGIVVLMNVGAFGNSTAIDDLANGIAATLLGYPQTAPTSSVSVTFSRLTALVPALFVMLWAGWSYRSLRRWQQRGEPPLHSLHGSLRLHLPLIVELGSIGAIWILVPAAANTPMAAIALFAPDVFAVAVMTTAVAVGCATARTVLALR